MTWECLLITYLTDLILVGYSRIALWKRPKSLSYPSVRMEEWWIRSKGGSSCLSVLVAEVTKFAYGFRISPYVSGLLSL